MKNNFDQAKLQDWVMTDYDHEIFMRELASFIPQKVFDSHTHLYRKSDFPCNQLSDFMKNAPDELDADSFLACSRELMPNIQHDGLFIPFPETGMDFQTANDFVADQAGKLSNSRAAMLVKPEFTPEYIHNTVQDQGFVALKCYHIFSPRQPSFDSSIEEFLPAEQVEVANEKKLAIILHMVRDRALADPINQKTINKYCKTYPDMQLVLAHAGRGFNPYHTIEGIESLANLDNVWFDSAAITEAGAFEAVIKKFGHQRLLYGSDYPISQLRGRYVAFGDNFAWLGIKELPCRQVHSVLRPTMLGIESLRMLKLAAMLLQLTDSQVEDIFYGNAARLFGL